MCILLYCSNGTFLTRRRHRRWWWRSSCLCRTGTTSLCRCACKTNGDCETTAANLVGPVRPNAVSRIQCCRGPRANVGTTTTWRILWASNRCATRHLHAWQTRVRVCRRRRRHHHDFVIKYRYTMLLCGSHARSRKKSYRQYNDIHKAPKSLNVVLSEIRLNAHLSEIRLNAHFAENPKRFRDG